MMFSQQPMMSHQSTADDDAYAGKSAETRHLKPGELSTGTTIMAVQFDGGVVLCAGE
jgi:20S proteasome alpha/beta subunit